MIDVFNSYGTFEDLEELNNLYLIASKELRSCMLKNPHTFHYRQVNQAEIIF